MSQMQIVEFQNHHVDDVVKVLAKSFISMNKAWKNSGLSFEEVCQIMRGKILPALESWNTFVVLEDSKLIGVSVSYDLLDTFKMPSMPIHFEFMKKLSITGQQLQKQMDISDLKKGDAIYGLYAVIDPDYANKGYSLRFWWQCLSVGKYCGWKYYYSRISSPISLKMVQKLGAEVVAQAEFVDGQLRQKFWMIRLDFSKPFPTYSMLKSMTTKEKKQPQAKL